MYLFGYESIQEISKSNKNSSTTTKFWLKKLFLILEHYQDNIVLSGIIYIDEIFYKVIKKDAKHAIDGNELKKLEDKDNPLDPINKVINLTQKFLNSHSGFNVMNYKDILTYLYLWKKEKGAPLYKVKRMVYLSLATPISLIYRDYYKKKPKIE